MVLHNKLLHYLKIQAIITYALVWHGICDIIGQGINHQITKQVYTDKGGGNYERITFT